MQIYEFLKVKKVKCIDVSGMCLTKDKEYQLLGVTDKSCIIYDDNGYEIWANMQRFEPVLDNIIVKNKLDELLKELLKTGRAKCIFDSGMLYLTKGKTYNVWGEYGGGDILVIDDSNMVVPYPLGYFETITIASKTTENSTKVGFESSFKVGDKVYKYGYNDIKTVLEVFENGYMSISNYPHRVNHESICHATQENYEMLCKLYPHIEFELPPKKLTGSDLTKGMFERGDFAVVCKCSNIGEISAIASSPLRLVIEYSNGRFLDNTGHLWEYAVPCNPKTNLPLTDDVLNDIN